MTIQQLFIPLLIATSSISATAQDNPANHFSIEGTLPAFQKRGIVYLGWEEPWAKKEFLKTELINGKFKFEGTTSQPTLGTMRIVVLDDSLKPIQKFPWECDVLELFICNGKTLIEGKDSIATARITSNCAEAAQLQQLNKKLQLVYQSQDSLAKEMELLRAKKDSINLKMLTQVSKKMNQRIDTIKQNFITNNTSSFLSLNLLNWYVYQVRDTNTAKKLELLWKRLSKRIQSSPLGVAVYERIDDRKDNWVGSQAINFDLKNDKGELISFSSFKGFILLDFWASWCAPCRQEFPRFKLLHEKYKDKGFNIVGVSIDNNESNWLQAIKNDGLPWPQLLDGDGFNGKAARIYKVSSVPKNFLIDPKGKIIGKNLNDESLERKLKEVFGEN